MGGGGGGSLELSSDFLRVNQPVPFWNYIVLHRFVFYIFGLVFVFVFCI